MAHVAVRPLPTLDRTTQSSEPACLMYAIEFRLSVQLPPFLILCRRVFIVWSKSLARELGLPQLILHLLTIQILRVRQISFLVEITF